MAAHVLEQIRSPDIADVLLNEIRIPMVVAIRPGRDRIYLQGGHDSESGVAKPLRESTTACENIDCL